MSASEKVRASASEKARASANEIACASERSRALLFLTCAIGNYEERDWKRMASKRSCKEDKQSKQYSKHGIVHFYTF